MEEHSEPNILLWLSIAVATLTVAGSLAAIGWQLGKAEGEIERQQHTDVGVLREIGEIHMRLDFLAGRVENHERWLSDLAAMVERRVIRLEDRLERHIPPPSERH